MQQSRTQILRRRLALSVAIDVKFCSHSTQSTMKPNIRDLERPVKKVMESLMKAHNMLSMPGPSPRNVGAVGGNRSYVMLSSLAKLEKALLKWTMNQLVSRFNFTPVVVPNIVYDHIIERCGFPTRSERSQVYKVSGNNQESILDEKSTKSNCENRTLPCVAGTSEFALTAIHIGDIIPSEELPKRYCALSRCYRAEISSVAEESGIYRVRYFNKVEMVGLTMPERSSELHEEFLAIQRDLFSQLGLQYRVLDMPEHELGLSAKKKYDVEAWMEGRQRYGEISSTSNCEDYQSSRLNIRYSHMAERNNQLQVDTGFVHTLNGTACSSTRTLIALIEQNQTDSDKVAIPEPLIPYMNGAKMIPCAEERELLKEVDLYPEL